MSSLSDEHFQQKKRRNARLSAARRIVAAELRSYDLLSKKAKIKYERHVTEAINANVYGPNHGYVCGHTDTSGQQISLCSPCDKCCRTQQDCVEYQVQLEAKLRDLLSKLK
jgi:hypothetical protein